MIAGTVVLIIVTGVWFGTLLCLDATFTSTATGLSTKEEIQLRVIAEKRQRESRVEETMHHGPAELISTKKARP